LLLDYQRHTPGIKVIRQDHGGSAAARNKGLALINSKYVMFCDADDEILELSLLDFETLAGKNYDLIAFSYELRKQDGEIQRIELMKDERCVTSKSVDNELRSRLMENLGFWRYAYRSEFLRRNQIRFIGELDEIGADYFVLDDFFFFLGALSSSKVVAISPHFVYRYYSNPQATMERYKRQSRFMARAAILALRNNELAIDRDGFEWFLSVLSEQTVNSFRVLNLIDAIKYQWSFRIFFWHLSALKNQSLSLAHLKLQVLITYLIIRKVFYKLRHF
jgi:glycosyltransferase involved in cell wall biosynthesis